MVDYLQMVGYMAPKIPPEFSNPIYHEGVETVYVSSVKHAARRPVWACHRV